MTDNAALSRPKTDVNSPTPTPQARTRVDCIPGTLCDARMWSRLTPLLGDNIDVRHVPLHEARTRAQMQALIASHSTEASHLAGFSLGAYLALEHALAHPQRVKSLTLVANSARACSRRKSPPASASSPCWSATPMRASRASACANCCTRPTWTMVPSRA
jgi:pimeloyl-ACP methyl ester carboxylesterase